MEGFATPFSDLMRKHAEEKLPQRPLVEAQIMELRLLLEAEHAANQFKVGDLVTPAKTGPYVLAGEPHIVIEVLDPPLRPLEETGLPDAGAPFDLRVGVIDRTGDKSVYLMRSIYLEAYTGEGAEAKPAADADGWIEWDGVHYQPIIPKGQRFEIMCRDGTTDDSGDPDLWQWQHQADSTADEDIVRYRLIS